MFVKFSITHTRTLSLYIMYIPKPVAACHNFSPVADGVEIKNTKDCLQSSIDKAGEYLQDDRSKCSQDACKTTSPPSGTLFPARPLSPHVCPPLFPLSFRLVLFFLVLLLLCLLLLLLLRLHNPC